MLKNSPVLLLIVIFLFSQVMTSQEIKIFKVEDFDLKGKVKSCLVTTKYGKEEYDFNQNGLLSKLVTRFNNNDYDITYYKYATGMLLEKRVEHYRDNEFDATSSIAHLYVIDSTQNLKITERIVSYEKEFLDQFEYFYTHDTLRRIVKSNDRGIDETLINYKNIKGERTVTYTSNDVLKESVRTSEKKVKDSVVSTIVLTKKYLNGASISATEDVFNGAKLLTSKTNYLFDRKQKQFTKQSIETFTHDSSGVLMKSESEKGELEEVREFVYQFEPYGNWVKEIITPDNTYKTRVIKYYDTLATTSKSK